MSKSRVTVVENVYHQTEDSQPTNFSNVFERQVSEGYTWTKTMQVGESWRPLPDCPHERVSVLRIKNEGAPLSGAQESEEQKQKRASKAVSLAVKDEVFALVPPGESLRFSPADISNLRLSSPNGEVRVTVTYFPG